MDATQACHQYENTQDQKGIYKVYVEHTHISL